MENIKSGINNYLNPLLFVIIGYLVINKLDMIEARLGSLESNASQAIELKARVDAHEKLITSLESKIEALRWGNNPPIPLVSTPRIDSLSKYSHVWHSDPANY